MFALKKDFCSIFSFFFFVIHCFLFQLKMNFCNLLALVILFPNLKV